MSSFRDLVRSIEDVRGDLMRARHRSGEVPVAPWRALPGPGRRLDRQTHGWLRAHCASMTPAREPTFVDYLAVGRAARWAAASTLIDALEARSPSSSHAPVVARLRCFRGIDTLTAAASAAEVGDFRRFPKPTLLSGFLGIVPSERTSDHKAPPGVDHQGRARPRAAAARRGRPPLPPPAPRRRQLARRQARPRPARDRDRLARPTSPAPALGAPAPRSGASPPASSRSPSHASSPRSSGRPPPLTDTTTDHRARDAAGARTSTQEGPHASREARGSTMGSRLPPAAPVPRQRAATNTGS